MKKVLFMYSGERKKFEQLIRDGKAPDTQLYGMNHMSEELAVEYKEFGDTSLRKFAGKLLGFRIRHMLMYFRTGGYDFVYGQSLIYTAFFKRVFGSGARYVLLNTSLNRLLNTHKKHSFTYRFVQWCLAGIEMIVCFSEVQRKELEEVHGIPPYKLTFVPFGVDTSFYSPVFSERKEYLLAVGRDNGRDYKTVIEVARKMPEREFHLILHPRNIAGITNIPENVKIIFNASPEEVRQAYAEAAALLLITQPDNYEEGSDCSGQTVLLDACAAGVPVIATDKAYISEYVTPGEDVLIVPPHDVDAIIAAIQRIPEQGSAMAQRARAKAEQEFSTKKFGERLSEIALMPWIIYIANARIPTQKAHGVQIIHTCEALARSGAHVELVIPYRRTDIHADPYSYYSVEKRFAIRKIPALDLVWAGPIGYRLHEFMFTRGLRVYLSRFFSPQIVYVRGEAVYMHLVSLTAKHRIFFESHIKQKNFAAHQGQYLKAAGVVVVTKYYQQELENAGFQNRVLWAPDGVDLRLFEGTESKDSIRADFQLPMNKPIVGYVGKLTTMDQEKGIGDLLQAFSGAWKKNSELFLLVVGATESEQKDVAARIARMGIPGGSYKVVGHVPHAHALRYMRAADVLIMNYPDSAHYAYYMSPLKLFEYMASSVAIISTDLPSVRDVLTEQNALLVPPGDAGALSAAIKEVVGNREKVRALATQARADVNRYSWEARALSLLKFIKEHV